MTLILTKTALTMKNRVLLKIKTVIKLCNFFLFEGSILLIVLLALPEAFVNDEPPSKSSKTYSKFKKEEPMKLSKKVTFFNFDDHEPHTAKLFSIHLGFGCFE